MRNGSILLLARLWRVDMHMRARDKRSENRIDWKMATANRGTSVSELRAGWRLVLSCMVGIALGASALPFYSIGVLLGPLTAHTGWTAAQVQGALSISFVGGALAAPLVGWLMGHIPVRTIALLGVGGMVLGFVVASQARGSLPVFYAGYAIVALFGSGASPLVWSHAIAGSFERQRGLAMGIALAGTGLAGAALPPYTVWAIRSFGPEGAYLALAALPALIALPLALAWFQPARFGEAEERSAGAIADTRPPLSIALGSYRFWVLLACILATYFATSALAPNLVPTLTQRGFALETVAIAMSVLGVSVIAGRLTVGYLVDKLWAPAVATAALLLPAIGCVILLGAPSYGLALAAAALIGFGAGAEFDVLGYLVSRYFGVGQYARVFALMYAAISLAAGLAPVAFAALSDGTGSHDTGVLAAAALLVVGAVGLLTLGRYPDAKEADEASRRAGLPEGAQA